MSDPPAGDQVAGRGPPDEGEVADDEEDDHWAVELLGSLAVVVMAACLLAAVAGLAGIAFDVRPIGDVLLAAGSVGGTGTMVLALVVAVLSGSSYSLTSDESDLF